jgi:3-dehydroquinate synthase II/3-amino-4-hydroxybenzoic acid synthase
MDSSKLLWFDSRNINKNKLENILEVVLNYGYDAIMLDVNETDCIGEISSRVKILFEATKNNIASILEVINKFEEGRFVIFSRDLELLEMPELKNIEKGYYTVVEDKESMNKSIEVSKIYNKVIIEFTSTTNIPLELILAFSQKYNSLICKKINTSEDGWIATMTMEMGSQAVLISTEDINEIIKLRKMMDKSLLNQIDIKELKVKEIQHIGMGERVCVDTISRLEKDEGMIIGSTSRGGILVSSENHYLPYMDLRPFRVNAGAIHSYVLCTDNRYRYLSELKAGDEVLVVNSEGKTRPVSIGRIKMEKRPMLLIRIEDEDGIEVNTIVQDDWHIRIVSEKGDPKNSVLLKPGDIVLGYIMKSGRHLGVEIEETILEK